VRRPDAVARFAPVCGAVGGAAALARKYRNDAIREGAHTDI